MATLMQHMKPWMQRSIVESEARIEKMMEQNIQAVHNHHNAFELRVLERSVPAIDVTTFQKELASLRADTVPEFAHAVPKDEAVMTALFGYTMPPPDSSRAAGKSHHSNYNSDTEEA